MSATCEHCGAPEAHASETHGGRVLCFNCFDDTRDDTREKQQPERFNSSEKQFPRTLSLVPCVTAKKEPAHEDVSERSAEPEVEALLAQYERAELEPMPEPIELPPLPLNATQPMRRVAAFFAVVRAVRLWAGDDRDVPMSCRWAGAKLGLSYPTASRALRELVVCGVLVRTDSLHPLSGREGRGTACYMPGPLVRQPVIVEARATVGHAHDPVEPESPLHDEAPVLGRGIGDHAGNSKAPRYFAWVRRTSSLPAVRWIIAM